MSIVGAERLNAKQRLLLWNYLLKHRKSESEKAKQLFLSFGKFIHIHKSTSLSNLVLLFRLNRVDVRR